LVSGMVPRRKTERPIWEGKRTLIDKCLMPFARRNSRPLTNKIKIIPLFIIPEYMPYDASLMQQLRKEINFFLDFKVCYLF
jgi:hypothetical protein